MIDAVLVLLGAMAIDLTLGEPPNALHPVVWMGRVISFAVDRAPRGRARELAFGVLLAVFVPTLFAGACAWTLSLVHGSRLAEIAIAVVLLKSTFAVRALGRAAFDVKHALARGDVSAGRFALRSLCSRDASALNEPALVAATVESVAENAADSVIAPLFYFVLFGVPGAVFYRAVNTLDAMIGYHGRFEYLGKASARLDDALNFVPARITAALLLLAGSLARGDVARGWRTLMRDGARTESPNAGRPMAAMAGLLRVELTKVGAYRLGDAIDVLGVAKIDGAWRVVCAAAAIATAVACFVLEAMHALHK